MKRTATISASNQPVTCEAVGRTMGGRVIWKSVEDAFECFTFEAGALWPYEPDSSLDDLGELYGTYVDESGERKEYVLEH